MTGPDRPWDDLHHRSYFLPELRRIEAGEFVLTVNGDSPCPINPLATHGFYDEGNMESIVAMIPIRYLQNPWHRGECFRRSGFLPRRDSNLH
jgi:hypothetical protein